MSNIIALTAANMRVVKSSPAFASIQDVGRSSATILICLASSSARSLRQSPSVKRDRRSTCSISKTSLGRESAMRRNSSGRASFVPYLYRSRGPDRKCSGHDDLARASLAAGLARGCRRITTHGCAAAL